MKNLRRLKINSKYQRRTYKHTTIPSIKLEGKWLEKLGFTINQIVVVKQKKNKLIITIENNNKQNT